MYKNSHLAGCRIGQWVGTSLPYCYRSSVFNRIKNTPAVHSTDRLVYTQFGKLRYRFILIAFCKVSIRLIYDVHEWLILVFTRRVVCR